jgi:DNA-binding transcriptional MerR regulator
LLAQALTETGRIGIGKYAARGKQYLVMVRPIGDKGLVMEQLHYPDELRSFAEVPVEDATVKPAELKLATQLIEQAASDKFAPENYRDEVRDRMLELINRKVEGETSRSRQPPSRSTRSSTSWRRSRQASPPATRVSPRSRRINPRRKRLPSPSLSPRSAPPRSNPDAMKAYSTREVADLLGIPAQRVRWLVRSGVVAPRLGASGRFEFSFQDLVLLRTAKGLADANLKPRKILNAPARARRAAAGRSAAQRRARADRRQSGDRARQQHELGTRVEADAVRLQRA